MPPILSTILIVSALLLAALVIFLIRQNKIPIKYSLLWFAFAILILLVSVVPDLITTVATFFGFQIMSNFLIGVVVVLLILLNIALTVMIASQRHRIKLISQELALLKKDFADVKKQK